MKKIKSVLSILIKHSRFCRKFFSYLFPHNIFIKKKLMENDYLEQYIHNVYSDESMKEKRFYNIGAGSQRSNFDFWTYIDLETSKYNKKGIDIFYDLESLSPIPIPEDYAEVVFNSFVIEHISVDATKNLCKEAFRILKKGGIFHSKVHCYEYAYRLYNNKLISPKIPFECRESNEILDDFLKKYNGKVKAFFNDKNEYVFKSLSDSKELVFNADNSFIYHNATAAIDNLLNESSNIRAILDIKDKKDIASFYNNLVNYVDKNKKEPHQHNASYFSKKDLFSFIKNVGFSEVYFTQPYQSVSPALWEDRLNPIHMGFLFSIEAIK